MRSAILMSISIVGLCAAACGGSGMGKSVRADVTARMESARDPIAACYGNALENNRKLKGTIVVAFKAAPSTGAFESVEVVRDDVGDPAVTACVVAEVGKLKLAEPQKTALAIEYPIDFAPLQ
jgi:hypothetical protein